MFSFTGKPEGPADTLSYGSAEAVWLWLYFSLFLFSEGARHEVVGCHPLFHSEGTCHAEMVGSAHTTRGWKETSLL